MMNLFPRLLLSLLALGLAALAWPQDSGPVEPKGKLVIVGGGGTTEPIQKAALLLTRKEKPRVLVLPQASGSEERGKPSADMWRKAGAGTVVNLTNLEDRRRALREIQEADLIWFPGGSQLLLLESLQKANLTDELLKRFQEGGVLGGTSAGAAAMGEVVIQGAPDPVALTSGAMQAHQGLALWPKTIIDQHFTARNRQARLLTAVLDRPEQLGVGIDERTGIVVEGRKLLVLGEGNVFLYDARLAQSPGTDPGKRQGALDLRMHVLRSGMEWSW